MVKKVSVPSRQDYAGALVHELWADDGHRLHYSVFRGLVISTLAEDTGCSRAAAADTYATCKRSLALKGDPLIHGLRGMKGYPGRSARP